MYICINSPHGPIGGLSRVLCLYHPSIGDREPRPNLPPFALTFHSSPARLTAAFVQRSVTAFPRPGDTRLSNLQYRENRQAPLPRGGNNPPVHWPGPITKWLSTGREPAGAGGRETAGERNCLRNSLPGFIGPRHFHTCAGTQAC